MDFFDANGMVGTSGLTPPLGLHGTSDVLTEARRFGITRILAFHAIGREWDPLRGNALLRPILQANPMIAGCWVAEPSAALDAESAEAQVQELIAGGFVSARLFPDQSGHNYELSSRGCRMFLSAAAERRLPVLIDTMAPTWASIEVILRNHSSLPVVLTGIGYRRSRDLYPLLDEYPALHVETSSLVAHGALEEMAEKFGADRLLFGTRLPLYAAGAAVARVALADLNDRDKADIAGETLESLIAGVA